MGGRVEVVFGTSFQYNPVTIQEALIVTTISLVHFDVVLAIQYGPLAQLVRAVDS